MEVALQIEKSQKPNLALIIGCINHLIFIAVVEGCHWFGFDCQSDGMAVLFWIHTFIFLIFQLTLEFFVIGSLIYFSAKKQWRWSTTSITMAFLFLFSLIYALRVWDFI